jgi:hypothetical protein
MQIKSVIKYTIDISAIFVPARQKILNRVFYTPGRRRKTFQRLPWRAQIVAFTIGTAFLLGCAENTVDKYFI